ncbi:hypothetical protein [Ruminiclostridium josui]|uniref:hypothetical protein n=1 Tax=Ruminiclostridium josui TaxID=1499 RepID=UPI00046626F1|nr:hypothetical protein [Ruminiclostridium josui]
MKKGLVFLILIVTILATFSTSVFAYTPAIRTSDGQTLEAEPNDYDEDATILWRTSTGPYLCLGTIRYIEDTDNYVFQSPTTQTRTLKLQNNSSLRVTDAYTYLSIYDITANNVVSEQHVEYTGGGEAALVPFQAIAGHDYIITVALEGPVNAIQARLDYLATINGGKGYTYVVFVN